MINITWVLSALMASFPGQATSEDQYQATEYRADLDRHDVCGRQGDHTEYDRQGDWCLAGMWQVDTAVKNKKIRNLFESSQVFACGLHQQYVARTQAGIIKTGGFPLLHTFEAIESQQPEPEPGHQTGCANAYSV